VIGKGQAGQLDAAQALAHAHGVEGNLVEAGAHVVQGVADHVGQVFQHGNSLGCGLQPDARQRVYRGAWPRRVGRTRMTRRQCAPAHFKQHRRDEEETMSAAMFAALGFTVALLVTTAYFIMGSIPLLVLKHDTPLDARFVRNFFNLYYVIGFASATATAISYALAGRPIAAAGAALLAAIAVVLRKKIIPKMEALGAQIQSAPDAAIAAFRKTHLTAIGINLAQLVVIVWSLIDASRAGMA